MAIDLNIYLPENLSNEFWVDFLDCFNEEFELLKLELLDPLKNFSYLRTQTDVENLIEVSETYGYTPNRRVLSDATYTNLVARLLNYKVKYKSSYSGYDFVFKAINTLGYVYNLYQFNEKLIRGLNDIEILLVLNDVSTDLSDPFIYFLPEFYYSESSVEVDQLDEGGALDEVGGVVTLDEAYVTRSTKHLSYEYTPFELITEDSVTYYMTNDYMEYLLEESIYNKKATEIPHAGFQVNAIMDMSGYFDNISGVTYSTPALELNCSLAFQNDFSGSPTAPTVTDLTAFFNKIQIGSGSQGLISVNYPDLNKNLIGYWDFNDSGSTFYDRTTTANNGTLSGTYTFGSGVISSGITFDGLTGQGLVSNVAIDNSEKTLSFWINGLGSSQATDDITLLDLENRIQVNYKVSTTTLTAKIEGASSSINLTLVQDILDNENTHIAIRIDTVTSNNAFLYVNGVLADTQSISTIGAISGTNDLFIATDNTTTNFFSGIVDEVRLYDILLSAEEVAYLYSSRLGNLEYLDNYFTEDSTAIDNRYEDTQWCIISGIYRFYDRSSYDEDELEELVTVSEIAILNESDEVVAYCTFPQAVFKKKFHLSFQFYIQK